MSDWYFAGVTGQAAAVAAGEVAPADLTRAALTRIDELNPRLNAFTEVLRDSALAEAADPPAGPLRGVPIAIKQEYDVAGSITTFGGEGNSTPAAEDSEAVRRLRAAGAIIIGKTNMPEFGEFPFTESVKGGITRNPWDTERSPGGSSGGTAVAVASGMVAAGMGGDGGGSIRIPSSCCGLFGLKPSRGRVSTAPNPHLWHTLGVLGPLTRSVLDSATIYDVVNGSLPSDAYQAPPADSFVEAAGREPGRLRIGWSTRSPARGVRPHKEVVGAVEQTARILTDLGHDVREVDPHYPDITLPFGTLFLAGVKSEAALVEHPERLEPRTKQLLRLGRPLTPRVVERAIQQGEKAAEKANRVFDDVDVLLTPTIASLPPRLPVLRRGGAAAGITKSVPMVAYTGLWNLTGNPAASCPVVVSRGGLPIGVQLVGRMYDETTLVSLAARLEEATSWTSRRPVA